MHNGFLYGVGANDVFLKSAKISASSVKDYFPDAHITLCAPERMIDHQCREIFDHIITGPNVPDSERTKLWALSKTPYEQTMYMDADTVCVSDEIQKCFSQLKDRDMLFTLIRKYNSNPRGFVHDSDYKYHGGVFLYNRKAIPLMTQWWDRWSRGQTEWDYPYTPNYRVWDQFYLYYLLKYTDHGLNVGVFEEDARWNFVTGYLEFELAGKPAIIRHFTIDRERESIL